MKKNQPPKSNQPDDIDSRFTPYPKTMKMMQFETAVNWMSMRSDYCHFIEIGGQEYFVDKRLKGDGLQHVEYLKRFLPFMWFETGKETINFERQKESFMEMVDVWIENEGLSEREHVYRRTFMMDCIEHISKHIWFVVPCDIHWILLRQIYPIIVDGILFPQEKATKLMEIERRFFEDSPQNYPFAKTEYQWPIKKFLMLYFGDPDYEYFDSARYFSDDNGKRKKFHNLLIDAIEAGKINYSIQRKSGDYLEAECRSREFIDWLMVDGRQGVLNDQGLAPCQEWTEFFGSSEPIEADQNAEDQVPDQAIIEKNKSLSPKFEGFNSWSEVGLKLTTSTTIEVLKNGKPLGVYNYSYFGLVDGRNSKPSLLWEYLKQIIKNNGELSFQSGKFVDNLKDSHKRLNSHLKTLFGICENITADYRKDRSYKFRFQTYDRT